MKLVKQWREVNNNNVIHAAHVTSNVTNTTFVTLPSLDGGDDILDLRFVLFEKVVVDYHMFHRPIPPPDDLPQLITLHHTSVIILSHLLNCVF